jgi:hypothetical protein
LTKFLGLHSIKYIGWAKISRFIHSLDWLACPAAKLHITSA